MLIDWVTQPHKKNRKKFKNIKTIFSSLLLFWKFYYVKLEAILKRLQGSFEEEVGGIEIWKPGSCEFSKPKIEHRMISQIR